MTRPRLCRKITFNPSAGCKKMDTFQSTFQRILTSACKKITDAIIEGKAIKIVK